MNPDFSGYATKNDLLCSDGRIIRHDAFKECDGKRVPLVWQHIHDDPTNVLGYMILKNRNDGIYAYGYFNNSDKAKATKNLVAHGDVNAMSIYANQLRQNGNNVIHGNIREVSLVLAGANPGATIENIAFAHSDGSMTESDDDFIMHMNGASFITHADEVSEDNVDSKPQPSDTDTKDNRTVEDVWNTFTEEQKQMVYFVIGQEIGDDDPEVLRKADEKLDSYSNSKEMQHADDKEYDNIEGDDETPQEGKTVEEIYNSLTDEQKKVADYLIGVIVGDAKKNKNTTDDEEIEETQEEGDSMKHNAFDGFKTEPDQVISHDDLNAALSDALHSNSMKDTFIQHGIENIDVLFPEAESVSPTPAMINLTPNKWVETVWNGVHKSPFSRIKSVAADMTKDEARAKGYIKGSKKLDEQFSMLYRKTTPQTVYKKQKLERDDIIDITDFDVVAWLKLEMRQKLNEELSRAILVGDGRDASAQDRINPENIRPIYQDSDVYTIHYAVEYQKGMDVSAKSEFLVDAAVKARKDYRGSGNPVFFASNEVITDMILARDKMGRRLYKDENELAAALRVSAIVETPVLESVTRKVENPTSHTMEDFSLLGLIVNLNDYTIGADKQGAVSFFDDFDIDYNQQKYLIETRCSGALTLPYSAIALETKAVTK